MSTVVVALMSKRDVKTPCSLCTGSWSEKNRVREVPVDVSRDEWVSCKLSIIRESIVTDMDDATVDSPPLAIGWNGLRLLSHTLIKLRNYLGDLFRVASMEPAVDTYEIRT
jgi:hypothetical protein